MFTHQAVAPEQPAGAPAQRAQKPADAPPSAAAPKEFTLNQVGELLEKNLKWSQIIYEQNRKINHKLFWSAFLGWFKFILIVGSLALGVWYLPALLKNLSSQYQQILGGAALSGVQTTVGAASPALSQILKLLPLDAGKEEQLKALLK